VTCRYVVALYRQVLGIAEGVCEKGRMTTRDTFGARRGAP